MKLLRSFSGFIVDVVGDDDADKNVNVEMPTLLKSQSFAPNLPTARSFSNSIYCTPSYSSTVAKHHFKILFYKCKNWSDCFKVTVNALRI